MSHHGKIASSNELNTIIFKDKASATVPGRFFSLFPGLGYAAGYKVRYLKLARKLYTDKTRSYNESTNMEDSHSLEIISRYITARHSTELSAQVTEKLSFTLLLEGELHFPLTVLVLTSSV
jgi:hypothetical protein